MEKILAPAKTAYKLGDFVRLAWVADSTDYRIVGVRLVEATISYDLEFLFGGEPTWLENVDPKILVRSKK